MSVTITAPAEWQDNLQEFFQAQALDVTLVTAAAGDLEIVGAGEARQACSIHRLYVAGSITCPTARALAKRLEISSAKLGQFLDLLQIKVTNCELGCF